MKSQTERIEEIYRRLIDSLRGTPGAKYIADKNFTATAREIIEFAVQENDKLVDNQ